MANLILVFGAVLMFCISCVIATAIAEAMDRKETGATITNDYTNDDLPMAKAS